MAPAPEATADKKKKMLFIGAIGAVLLLAIVLIVVLKARGSKAPSPGAEAKTSGAPAPTTAAPRARGARRTTRTAPAKAAVEARPTIYPGEKEPNRPDPFISQIPPIPIVPIQPPLPPSLPAVIPMAGGIRVQESLVPVTTLRRTVGILWNDQVYGVLQLGDQTYIVRPGDTVSEYTVSAITRDSIVLYSPAMHKQIQVPLQGPRSELPEQIGEGPITESFGAVGGAGPEGGEPVSGMEELVPALPEFPPQ